MSPTSWNRVQLVRYQLQIHVVHWCFHSDNLLIVLSFFQQFLLTIVFKYIIYILYYCSVSFMRWTASWAHTLQELTTSSICWGFILHFVLYLLKKSPPVNLLYLFPPLKSILTCTNKLKALYSCTEQNVLCSSISTNKYFD